MDSLLTLMKRKHVASYNIDIEIPKGTVEKLLHKTWQATSSKNNFMPYSVHVLGPDKKEEKILVWKKCVAKQQYSEDQAVKQGKIKKAQTKANPYYNHIKENSHLLIFTPRVCDKPTRYCQKQIEEGHYAQEMFDDQVNEIINTTSIEVGMFASHLTLFCMEQDIDVSYAVCMPVLLKNWQNLPFVKHRPIMLMSLGYGGKYRSQNLQAQGWKPEDDFKPEINEVVKWI